MKDHYDFQLELLRRSAQSSMRRQCKDVESPYYGINEWHDERLMSAHLALTTVRQLVEAYYTPGSAYEGDKECLIVAIPSARFALSRQHEDGTADLLTTNFHDASETGFSIHTIAPAYLLMEALGKGSKEEETLKALLYQYIDRSGTGMINGGFHTPNHRWVQSAAMALCAKITGRQDVLDRMNQYLNEGIDCDEEGEYTERSAGVYNIICNRSMIYLAYALDDPSYLTHVTKNLRMVMKYFEPDFTVNTMNSTRQDMGNRPDWKIYYHSYLYMALVTGDAEFAAVADKMLSQMEGSLACNGTSFSPRFEFLPLVVLDEKLRKAFAGVKCRMPDWNYEKMFVKSGIVRYRQGDFSITVLKNQANFMKMQYKDHEVFLRIAGSFFAIGQFVGQTLEKIEGGYRMTFRQRWGYKQPYAEKPPTTDWRQLDYSQREDVMMLDFGYDVEIRPQLNGAEISVSTMGVDGVPVKLEVILAPGGRYVTDGLEFNAHGGAYVYQKCDQSDYLYPDYEKLHVTGGFSRHTSGEHMRGSIFADDGHFILCFNDFTPLSRRVTLQFC